MVACSKREFKRILGVALGGGRGKNTAVASLRLPREGKPKVVHIGFRDESSRLWYDDVLTSYVLEKPNETLLALDVPLTLPVCVRCPETQCLGFPHCPFPSVKWFLSREKKGFLEGKKPRFSPYTQRVCEKYLENKYGIKIGETLGHSVGPLTARAQHLIRRWNSGYRLNENLLEVRSRITLGVLWGNKVARACYRGPHTWETRAEVLENLKDWLDFTVWREPILQNRRCFKALINGFTGYLLSVQGWRFPEEMGEIALKDGWIWAPINEI